MKKLSERLLYLYRKLRHEALGLGCKVMQVILLVRHYGVGRVLLAAIFVALCGCDQPRRTQSEWKRYSSVEGRFSAEFPRTPATKTVRGRMNDARFQDAIFMTAEMGALSFMVGYSDEFDDVIEQFSIDQILDAARDGALLNMQGQMISELSTTRNGFPGRDVQVRGNGLTGRVRIYLVQKRKYVLGVFGSDGAFAVETKRFLDSFDFTEPMGDAKATPMAIRSAFASSLQTPTLTEAESNYLSELGLDPSLYEVDESGEFFRSKKSPAPPLKSPAPLPAEIRYFIIVKSGSGTQYYYSKTEPKPFGSAFKFKVYPSGTEIAVSGDVQIVKLR